MITIGVDFHKRTSTYHVIGPEGAVLKRCRMENGGAGIRNFIASWPGPREVAVEATRSWGLFHDTVKDLVDEFHLGHPKKIKALIGSQMKNDQRDASEIARLTRAGMLPRAHASSAATRHYRSLLRLRYSLVNQRRGIRNQVQTLLDRNIWPTERPKSFKDPFCRSGRAWMSSLVLPKAERFILETCLSNFDVLCEQIRGVEAYLRENPLDAPGMALIRTVPGFQNGGVNAAVVLAEIADIGRFPKARSLAHYAGLVPREYSSGDKHRTGRLVKDANMHLRTALLESCLAAVRKEKGLRAYYKQVKERRGSGPAIVATARKLLHAVFWVLKEQRPYRPEPLPF